MVGQQRALTLHLRASAERLMRILMIIEEGPGNLSAYVPDLPGCIATGTTLEQLRANMRAAVVMHIAGMEEDGLAVTDPTPSTAEFLEID